ncbi:hypothetical protein GCM10010872_29410 [Dyella flava]|nr:hypothetical protein GCM10010872_29410 [Dyella flava]
MRKYLPAIEYINKESTAMCAEIFEELDATLILLDAARLQFNPLQRQLADRFILACKGFGRDMLAAEGNRDALREILDLPTTDSVPDPSKD